jgi:hypothetical protein
MRTSQSNKLSMYDTVLKFLKGQIAKVNTVVQFVLSLTTFETAVQNIKDKEKERQTASTGKTDAKHIAEEDLISLTANIAAGLFAYARKTNKPELKALTDITESKLGKLKDTDLASKCMQIYDAAKTAENEIDDYGVTTAMITELKTQVEAYQNIVGDRDASAAKRTGAGLTLVEMFNKADDILVEELDKFVDKFKAKDIEFYEGYYAARSIKDLGGSHGKSNGKDQKTPDTPTTNPS